MANKYASATGNWSTMTWLNGHTGATQMHPQRRLSVKAKSIPKSIIWCAFNIYSLYAFWKINRGLRGFAWIKNCKMNFKKYIISLIFAFFAPLW